MSEYETNLKRFWFYLDEIINRASLKCQLTADCKPILQEYIDPVVDRSKEEIAKWNAYTDVEMFAYKVIYNASFDILSSGKVHVYRGQLDPVGPGQRLLQIVYDCLDYYQKNGYATKADVEDQIHYLLENISSVG